MSPETYFAERPDIDRAIFEAVDAHIASLGEAVVEVVSVGILVKRARTFVELRPRRQGMALSFLLLERIEHPRITRHIKGVGMRTAHFVTLIGPEDVDATVRDWLTEAYLTAPA